MKKIFACRPGCYDLPLAEALKELKKAGLDYAEVNLPEDDDYESLFKAADEAGITVSSLGYTFTLDDEAGAKKLSKAICEAGKNGVKVIFLAVCQGKISYEEGIEILKKFAGEAADAGVVLSVETHVPFGHNGEAALKTMQAVNSPGIGHNFDTANIYYYNPRGIDTVEELKKTVDYVSSVHLKESAKGEPETFDFPVFGEGIVDFPEVFRILDAKGFNGPYTLELEGPLVNGLPVEERTAKVKACMNYLKDKGLL
jgi:sugar phosphate isomerase/epimerase